MRVEVLSPRDVPQTIEPLRQRDIDRIFATVDAALQNPGDKTVLITLSTFVEDVGAIKNYISAHDGTQRVATAFSDLFVVLSTNDAIVTVRLMMPPKLEALADEDEEAAVESGSETEVDSFEYAEDFNTQQIDDLDIFD